MNQVDWRRLFNSIGVDWRDRGPNTSRDRINICCPFCNDDPSFHLSIREHTNQYYCFRDPRHSGSNPERIIIALGKSRRDTNHLLDDFAKGEELEVQHSARAGTTRDRPVRNEYWSKIPPATEPACLDYLASRGFANPESVVHHHDLRFRRYGVGSWRLLFPLWDEAGIKGWTGRALRDHVAPKYLTSCIGIERCVTGTMATLPRIIIVEGPMDALKINSARVPGIGAVAILGSNLTAGRIRLIHRTNPTNLFLCFDNDAAFRVSARDELGVHITRLVHVPEGYKDAGEMSEPAVREWLQSL